MNRHCVRLADVTVQPWRNGGGVTRELLAWPQPAGWQLRVSVAEIERDGPFSPFPGVDRWFAVIEGAGVELAWASGTRTLRPGEAPLQFAGEAAPACRLLQGPTRDLNFMHRRGAGVASMRPAHAGSRAEGGLRWRGLYVADEALIDLGEQTEPLAAGTLLWSERNDAEPPARPWQLQSAGRAWWLTLETR
ncbi:MAG: HutD family protein [Betaproteobacteria bacterium]|nr:HutD family protein [Betaproteobacteria bacterium]